MLLENGEIVCWMLPISIFGMKSLERNPFHQHHMSGVPPSLHLLVQIWQLASARPWRANCVCQGTRHQERSTATRQEGRIEEALGNDSRS